jgi:hypothetical protein
MRLAERVAAPEYRQEAFYRVVGIYWATIATATTALAILPLVFALASELQLD